jgi:hypothetical protein
MRCLILQNGLQVDQYIYILNAVNGDLKNTYVLPNYACLIIIYQIFNVK